MPTKRVTVVCLLQCLLVCQTAFSQQTSPNWVRIAEKTAFVPRDSCGEMVYKDRLWLIGGWVNSYEDPPRDVWNSSDGIEWKRVSPAAEFKHSDFAMTTVFQDKMWVIGGWHGGRLPHASASNQTWSSTDGLTWKQETSGAAWTPRMAGALVVFKDQLLLLGGIQKYYYGNEQDLKNDVWSTKDGVKWDQVTNNAGWKPRAYHQAVVLDNKIYVYGGGNYVPKYEVLNDVWCSEDGANWTQVTEKAPWSPRIWFSGATYRDHIWMIGGWSNNPNKNWNDVWYSANGKDWTELKSPTTWTPRHEHSVYVHQDKLWVVAGHAAPLSNEVWQLELSKDWNGKADVTKDSEK